MPRSAHEWEQILEATPEDSRRRPAIERHLETAKQRESERAEAHDAAADLGPDELADLVRNRMTGGLR